MSQSCGSKQRIFKGLLRAQAQNYVLISVVFPIKRNSRGEHPAALKLPPPVLKLPLLSLFSF